MLILRCTILKNRNNTVTLNPHLCHNMGLSRFPRKFYCALFQLYALHPNPRKQNSDFLLILEVLPVLKLNINRIIQHVLFVSGFFNFAHYLRESFVLFSEPASCSLLLFSILFKAVTNI